MYEPNFILIGKPYTPAEKWQQEMRERLETWSKIEDSYRKLKMVDAAIAVVTGVAWLGVAYVYSKKGK